MKYNTILDGYSTELRNIMCYFYFYAPFEIVARSLYFDPFAWYQTWYCGWPSRVDDPLGFQVAGSTDKVKPIVSWNRYLIVPKLERVVAPENYSLSYF